MKYNIIGAHGFLLAPNAVPPLMPHACQSLRLPSFLLPSQASQVAQMSLSLIKDDNTRDRGRFPISLLAFNNLIQRQLQKIDHFSQKTSKNNTQISFCDEFNCLSAG